jgi:hypothetical protein
MGLLVNLPLLILTALLLNASFPARGRLANWLALACIAYGEIVLITEILSELHAIGLAGYTIGQLLLFGLAALLWQRRGRPHLLRHWWFPWHELKQGMQNNLLLTLFAACVSIVSLVHFVYSAGLPVSFSDSVAYHLPRAYSGWTPVPATIFTQSTPGRPSSRRMLRLSISG